MDGRASGDGVNSKTGFNIKGSGLNPARNLGIIQCSAKGTSIAGLMMHALQAEGTQFAAVNFSIEGGKVSECTVGFNVITAGVVDPEDSPAAGYFVNGRVSGVQVDKSLSAGFTVTADDVEVTDIQVSRSQARAGTITGSDSSCKAASPTTTCLAPPPTRCASMG